jgi:hypothetical protein
LWLSESGCPGLKDVQDLIDFLPDEDKCNIQLFPIVGLNRLELLDREFIPWLLAIWRLFVVVVRIRITRILGCTGLLFVDFL